MQDVIMFFFSLLVVVGIILLAYFGSKYLAKKMPGTIYASKYVEVLERIPVAQDKYLMIIKLNGKLYLLSVTSANISLIKELEEDELVPFEIPEKSKPDFGSAFVDALKKNFGVKKK